MNHADLIKRLFKGHATATSAEATLFFQGAGLSYKAAGQALARAFRDGLIRRKKMKRAKGYEFRLHPGIRNSGKAMRKRWHPVRRWSAPSSNVGNTPAWWSSTTGLQEPANA